MSSVEYLWVGERTSPLEHRGGDEAFEPWVRPTLLGQDGVHEKKRERRARELDHRLCGRLPRRLPQGL